MQLIVLLFVSLMAFPVFAETVPVQDAISQMRSNYEQINSREDVQQRLIVPATSDQVKMQTLNGNQTFDATLVCPGAGPVLVVTMMPEGTIQSPGELRIIAEYDSNLDGNLDVEITSRHVGGMCSDGYIADCNPAGSWEECKYYKWFYQNGEIQSLAVDPDNNRDISIADLHGCFCFNQSCGSPIMGNIETILSYYANGILDLLRQNKQDIVITQVKSNPEEMQISFIGASVTTCTTNSNELYGSKDVQELTKLQNQVEFNEDPVIDSAETDPNSPWSLTQKAFMQANQEYEYRQCTIRAKVAPRTEIRTRNPKLACKKVPTNPQDPVWVDWTGTEGPGYWYADYGKTKHVLQQNELMRIAISPSYCDPAPFIQTNVEVLCGDNWISVWSRDLGYDWGGCSGGTWDSINIGSQDFVNYVVEQANVKWPRWKYECGAGDDQCLAASDLCRCVITDDVFTCYSPSMGPGDGSLIINGGNSTTGEEYNKVLFQGCEEITDPENGCLALQNDSNCELVEEITDGVPTIKGGAATGLEPFPDCRLIEGSVRSITVCEPWWEKERIYRCSNNATDFSQVQQRVEHISSNIQYDNSTGEWTGQGDLQFDENGTSYSVVFDPNIQFKAQMENCEPACLVAIPNKNTNIMVHGLDNTVNFNQSKVYVETRACIKNDETGQYECPYNATEGETISTPCTCFDQKTFSEVTSEMATLKSSSMDMICSSGDEAGVCGPEDEGIQTNRVICVTDPTVSWSSDGELTVENGTVQDCSPNTWQNTNGIPDQTHTIKTTNDYRCWAGIDDFSEEMGSTTDSDYFQNNLGSLAPVSSWFDPVVEWAKSLIIDHLKSDPYFIPDPGPDCPCQGSDSNSTSTQDGSGGTYECTWTVETSVENINRQDDLILRPDNQDPFGDVYLFFSRVGQWGGTHYASCTQDTSYTDISNPGECELVSETSCSTSCPSSISLYIDVGLNRLFLNSDVYYDSWYDLYVNGQLVKEQWVTDYIFLTGLTGNDVIEIQFKSYNVDLYFSEWTRNPIRIKDINGNLVEILPSRSSFSETVTITLSTSFTNSQCVIQATAKSSLGTENTSNILYCPGDFTVQGDCTQIYDPIQSFDEHCFANNNDAGCNNWRYCHSAGRNSVCWTCYGSGRRRGFGIVYVPGPGSCWYPYDRGYYCGPIIWSKTYPPGGQNANEVYNQAKALCEYPYVCSGDNKAYLTLDECTLNCSSTSKDVYYCSTTGAGYGTQEECTANCSNDPLYLCASGDLVSDPTQCPQWFCPISKGYFSTESDCLGNCTEPISCNAQTDDYRFKVTIRNNGLNDYTQELDLIEPEARHIDSDVYAHEDLILQQCVDRYFKPFLNFDDPTFGGHFEYALIDLLIYQYAGVNNQIIYDKDTHLLPDDDQYFPIVYRPSSNVPLIPQFPGKQYTTSWSDDDTLRLGYYTIQLSNLYPLIYYYECPEGQIVAGDDPNMCNANPRPLGGVDDTIKGNYCFENRCTRAYLEPQDRVYSGCGFINDGTWQ